MVVFKGYQGEGRKPERRLILDVIDMVKKGGCWTIEAFIIHQRELRLADRELATALRAAVRELAAERDRRYTEGNELRAMALKIKETADRDPQSERRNPRNEIKVNYSLLKNNFHCQ